MNDDYLSKNNRFYDQGLRNGTLLTIPFFEHEPENNWISIDDFEILNVGLNDQKIFIAPDPVGGAGGAGGVYIPPETIQVLQIIIRDVAIGMSASLLYDGLKEAIKRIVKFHREKKDLPTNNSWQILHNQGSVSIIVVDGEVDDKLLDSSLRSLLNESILRKKPDFHIESDEGLG